MQTREEEIQQVEVQIEHAREIVAFGDAIDRLVQNKDFQTVIDKGYMTEEARRLAMLSADPNLTEVQRNAVQSSIRAIGELAMYFRVHRGAAEQMRKEIMMAEEELESMHAEDAEEIGGEGELQA